MKSLPEQLTVLILTFNEAPNIGRALERLTWAKDIVVVDSGSTDETEAIAGFGQSVLGGKGIAIPPTTG